MVAPREQDILKQSPSIRTTHFERETTPRHASTWCHRHGMTINKVIRPGFDDRDNGTQTYTLPSTNRPAERDQHRVATRCGRQPIPLSLADNGCTARSPAVRESSAAPLGTLAEFTPVRCTGEMTRHHHHPA